MEQNNKQAQLKYKFNLTSRNCLQFTMTHALNRFLKMPLPAATHTATQLSIAQVASCNFH